MGACRFHAPSARLALQRTERARQLPWKSGKSQIVLAGLGGFPTFFK